jgi:hypothetical protein
VLPLQAFGQLIRVGVGRILQAKILGLENTARIPLFHLALGLGIKIHDQTFFKAN